MKISAINQSYYHQYYIQTKRQENPQKPDYKDSGLQQHFYYPANISFGLENAKNIKTLFSYGLPCMYTGIEMIDPQKVKRLIAKGVHKLPAIEVCKFMDVFFNSMLSNEKEVYVRMKEQVQIEPNKNIKEIFQSLKKQLEYELIKEQTPVFKTLMAYSYALPDDLREKLHQLLTETEDKINNKPIASRFSVTEFKYKLEKIKEDVAKLYDKKSLGIVNHFIKRSQEFAPKTNEKNVNSQRKIVSDMETILKRSVLIENSALNDLIKTSLAKLNNEKTIVPFSRKAFIYDLSQIIKDSEDDKLREAFMKIAEKLPTSRESDAAYITKFAKESTEKILYRLLWPSLATVEHIFPRSCGGANVMSNYGGACARENSNRKNIPFIEWIQKKPETAIYCQKYVDRLIEYAKAGIFEKENINIKYIEDFKNTIAAQSEGAIVLDTSKLYKVEKRKTLQELMSLEV